MRRENIDSLWWGQTYALNPDAELDLVDIIKKGTRDDATTMEKEAAHDAVNELVSSYSPLIEKIARERMVNRGGFTHEPEDFIAEAYVVALQCAYKFDPYKAATPIRFSSYVARALVSSLQRLSLRTHATSSVPASVLSRARQWSHVYYDMESKGFSPSDEEVSEICGSRMTKQEVSSILGATDDKTLDDVFNVGTSDARKSLDKDNNAQSITAAINEVYGDYADAMRLYLGIGHDSAAVTMSAMSQQSDISDSDIRRFFDKKDELIHHPGYRMEIAYKLGN